MCSKLINGAIWWFLCIGMIIRQSNGADFDVKKYGAKADGKSDDSQAMVSAWKEACASADPSRVVIAKGNYMVGPVKFEGPCKAPITILAQGDWKAPADVRQFESHDGWIVLENIDGLTLSGGGSFDGQGAVAWQQNDCAKTGKCNSLPIVSCLCSNIIVGVLSTGIYFTVIFE
ncbi:galacturonan 1,4-alpha-galacturonidase [Sarracenia purpurea var. burkii]